MRKTNMKQKLTKLEKYWVLYDVGNSAFTLLVSTIIPIYFKNMAQNMGVSASDSTAYLSYAISISTIIVAILGPILGAVADNKNHKKPLFTFFMMIGVLGCAALSIPKTWLMFLIIFVIAKVGFSGSLIFYDSMMVDVTTDERMDEVSSHGYAWGYIGSCVPFVISLLLVLGGDKVGISTPAAMTAAFFFYIDGVYTIIEMATSYGKDVGISDANLLLALLLTQVVAFPCAILFGKMTQKFETGKLISVCIIAYFAVAVYALQLDAAWKFWMMATFVGVFQGAIQALSRSYYAKIIPKEKSSEYFGIFDIFGKGASFMGTMLMGISTQIFDTSKAGVVVIAAMFVVGFVFFQVQRRTEEDQNGLPSFYRRFTKGDI